VLGVLATASPVVAVAAADRALCPQPEIVTPSAPLSPLSVADGKLKLREVWDRRDTLLAVPASDRTGRDIEIRNAETSGGCGKVSPRKLTVSANETATTSSRLLVPRPD